VSKKGNRVGFTVRFNNNELAFMGKAMLAANAVERKEFIKFSTLKMSEIILQQADKQAKEELKKDSNTPTVGEKDGTQAKSEGDSEDGGLQAGAGGEQEPEKV